MPLCRVLSLLAVLAVGATASTSVSVAAVAGDPGPPKTKSECLKRLKAVDKSIAWVKDRYDKKRTKKMDRIEELTSR